MKTCMIFLCTFKSFPNWIVPNSMKYENMIMYQINPHRIAKLAINLNSHCRVWIKLGSKTYCRTIYWIIPIDLSVTPKAFFMASPSHARRYHVLNASVLMLYFMKLFPFLFSMNNARRRVRFIYFWFMVKVVLVVPNFSFVV
jgi:hypothetical protein